ncbi:hypothetical protein SLEP1_g51637 [Rubroshorea leprosula]|uniref:Uncharacterized protein n=1 Tax=Rubroshorea leprosula TaxID=152421 RepID=A0AAV5M608_9ROSI|nr:hypothetical protein SLEP1_g51637 [Rubroshorea leprosula]
MSDNIALEDSRENLDIATGASANIFEILGNAFFETDADMISDSFLCCQYHGPVCKMLMELPAFQPQASKAEQGSTFCESRTTN